MQKLKQSGVANKPSTNLFKRSAISVAIISAALSSQVMAGETIELGQGVNLDWKGTAVYSAAVRTEDQAPELPSAGNSNFDKGDMTANGLSLLVEGHLSKDNYGLVMSASTFHDFVYQDDKFSDDTEKYHGGYSRLLDLYAYTTFGFGESGFADIRVGKHVVAWGEGLFFPSISLAQGPSDAIKSGIPGTEVKDILLPEDQVSMQLEITPNLSLMAHYQYDWHETLVPEPGSFLSTGESVGKGAYCMSPLDSGACGFGVRGDDIQPDDGGQWGIGTRYRVSDNTEIGFYYLNYQDRIPMVEIEPMANSFQGAYQVRYFDDIDLYGATYSTTVGMASIAAEVSYKQGTPVLVNTEFFGSSLPSAARGDVLQTNVNAIINFGSTVLAQSTTLTTELAYVDVLDVEARGINGVQGSETDDLYYTGHGLAIATSLNLAYPGITESWDMGIPISYSNQLSGRSITGGVGGEGDHRLSVGADFTHHRSGIQLGIKYLAYMGDPDVDEAYKQRTLSDRDNVSLTAKYAF